MTNYVTKKQLEQIIYDQNKDGKFICLDDDNKIWIPNRLAVKKL